MAGAAVNYALPTATDLVDGVRPVTSSHAPTAVFPLGTTTVTFRSSDLATPPNTATATFTVTVVDTTPPLIGAVADITIAATGSGGAIVTIPRPAATDVADPRACCDAQPGVRNRIRRRAAHGDRDGP